MLGPAVNNSLNHDPTPVIEAADLTKTYTFHRQEPGVLGAFRSLVRRRTETRLAVDRITFAVGAGEVVGLLGPNGAGKTTTLKMLAGLLYPTAGSLEVLGFTPHRRKAEYLRRIALVMGQKTMLWWDVPTMDSLLLHKDMYDLDDAGFRATVGELAELLDVTDLLRVQVRKLSLGERMKCELLAALVHRPEVLFLDEPTIGLDVVAKARVRAFLADLNRLRGTTIVVTSHDMDDIEALCSRVLIIDHGRIGFDGTLAALVREVQPHKTIVATYADPIALDGLSDRFPDVAVTVDPASDGRTLLLETPRERMSATLETLPRLGSLADLTVRDAAVEEIIRQVFERSALAQPALHAPPTLPGETGS
ncbi:MAG: ATP-binding cassette domain-containing protein [Chloroflexia bacterium]|nr:ATP-binding cassette domain-containing protein [Chloroflexia bacterium]